MREYEITYIVNPSLEETKRGELDSAIDTTINELGGDISFNTESIRRKLAYPLEKQRVSFLRVLQTKLPTDKVADLKKTIQRLDGVMRVTVLQTARRGDVTPAIFEAATKQQQVEPKKVKPKTTKKMSDQEVEEKIEQALEEEVK